MLLPVDWGDNVIVAYHFAKIKAGTGLSHIKFLKIIKAENKVNNSSFGRFFSEFKEKLNSFCIKIVEFLNVSCYNKDNRYISFAVFPLLTLQENVP